MRLRAPHPHQPAGKVNVTPLIDVVMVLIVFYLIVGNLARERLAPVRLPATGVGVGEESGPGVVITVAPRGEGVVVVIEGEEVREADLDAALRARVSDPGAARVEIRADRGLSYGAVRPVVEACRRVGLTSVRLVAERGAPR